MKILAVKTDVPQAELYLLDGQHVIQSTIWQAHRQLSSTIHTQINALLMAEGCTIHTLTGIIFYSGPGSFTGLRIGASVANALAASLQVPIVAVGGTDWLAAGSKLLADTKVKIGTFIEPFYGSDAIITKQK